MKYIKKFDILWLIPITAVVVIAFMAAFLLIDGVVVEEAYVILREPDGSVVEGYGRYMPLSGAYVTVEINGIKYTTSYQNIVLIRK